MNELAYYMEMDRDEKHVEWVEAKSEEMANRWCQELQKTGRVEFFDWDLMDFACVILEVPVIGDTVDFIDTKVFDYLCNKARKLVSDDPDQYAPEPDYESLNWD